LEKKYETTERAHKLLQERAFSVKRRRFIHSTAAAGLAAVSAHADAETVLSGDKVLKNRAKEIRKKGKTVKPSSERLRWWQEARFGMFITWGVYVLEGRGEWIRYQEHIPFKEYARLADRFKPRSFNPRDWVTAAQDTGMKYIVFVTRHHDGYCLFDSRVSDFTSTETAAGRDFVAEFAEACHDAGMRMGLYYSLIDWRFPGVLPHGVKVDDATLAPMVEQAHSQVRELLTNYGTVDILWYDMLMPYDSDRWRSSELNEMARNLQPDILINNRAGLPEDFGTPENVIIPENRAWEACYTMNRSWSYCPTDHNYKPPAELIRLLASCVSDGGNLLLNVSPDPDGRIPAVQMDRLNAIGKWMRTNGDAIYGCGKSPVSAPALGLATKKGNKVYLLLQRWPGATLPFAWCGSNLIAARLRQRTNLSPWNVKMTGYGSRTSRKKLPIPT